MAGPVRVLIADDSPDITDMLEYVLNADPQLECVGCLHSADELAGEVRRLRPDILILDASMPGKDPLTVMAEFATEFPEVRAIFHSGYDDDELIGRVIDAGAWGFVSKREDVESVLSAIRAVAAGKTVFPDRPPRAGQRTSVRADQRRGDSPPPSSD